MGKTAAPAGVKGGSVLLPFADLLIDPGLRTRPVERDHVEGLADAIRGGAVLPRVKVRYLDGRGHFVTGGFQTLEAYGRAGHAAVPCSVKPGSWEEALVEAASQNHEWDGVGLRRTNAVKRRAVVMLLGTVPHWSDRKIAAAAGVSNEMVGAVRADQVSESDTCPAAADSRVAHREGIDGKLYPATVPLYSRTRPNTRPDYPDGFMPSREKFGAAYLPIMSATGKPYSRVLAAHQFNVKQASLLFLTVGDQCESPTFIDGEWFESERLFKVALHLLQPVLREYYGDNAPLSLINFVALLKHPELLG